MLSYMAVLLFTILSTLVVVADVQALHIILTTSHAMLNLNLQQTVKFILSLKAFSVEEVLEATVKDNSSH